MFHLNRLVKLPTAYASKYVIKYGRTVAAVVYNTPCPSRRCFHDEFNTTDPQVKANVKTSATQNSVPTAVAARYQAFRDIDATVILDIDEERERHMLENLEISETDADPDAANDIYAGLNMEREYY